MANSRPFCRAFAPRCGGHPNDLMSESLSQASYEGYSHEHRPLGGYAVLAGAFAVAFGGALTAAQRKRGGLPERPDAWDAITAGVTTYKVTRIISKTKVMSIVRAPFVRFEEETGFGEVSETPRGEGLHLAIGELLVCPYCLGQWVAGAITVGYVGAPRLTRLMTSLYTAQAISDFTQLAYKASEDAVGS